VVAEGWSKCYIEVIAKAVDKPLKEEEVESQE
jgi:hypothetical protein